MPMPESVFKDPCICILRKTKNASYEVERLSIGGNASTQCISTISRASSRFLCPTAVEYSPEYKLDSDQIFVIRDFPLPQLLQNAFRNSATLKTYSPGSTLDIITVANKDSNSIAFQRVKKSQILSNKLCLFLSGDSFVQNNKTGFVINESINCLYHGNDLYFTSYNLANQIFDLKQYYEEASDAAVKAFINNNLFELEDVESFTTSIKTHEMRRKLVLVEKTGVLNHSFEEIVKIAEEKNIPIRVSNDRIIIPKDRQELRIVIGFLTDKVFRSNFTNELFITNSVQNIPE